ncbi:pyridoxal phosphate-dependent aminotransferase [Aerococcaceae bacterium DSM 111022]|nr:pyridoxal phosphate-dependent aminotransferase [Aerococcaceae bacterium DSM 111022]
MFNFDEIIDRRKSVGKKWNPNTLDEMFGNPDALPMWIADMDFRVAPAITEAIKEVAEHGIYGYSNAGSAVESYIGWVKRRHNWDIKPEWVLNTPGVVTALDVAIAAYTKPGDGILINKPVYYPFSLIIESHERKIVDSTLVIEEGGAISVDFADFEAKAKDENTKMFILCSPHNPLGHIYSRDELKRMLDICFKYDVLVVVDEIHGDLIMPGQEFTSIGELGEKYANRVIVTQAPSKTFNLAGMQWSAVVIPDADLRAKFQAHIELYDLAIQNPLAIAAVSAAYDEGAEWLDAAIGYIYANFEYLRNALAEALPDARVLDLKATYLAFVDFSYLGLDDESLDKLFAEEIGLALDSGHWFGETGSGYMRFNLATPRANVEKAVELMVNTLQEK